MPGGPRLAAARAAQLPLQPPTRLLSAALRSGIESRALAAWVPTLLRLKRRHTSLGLLPNPNPTLTTQARPAPPFAAARVRCRCDESMTNPGGLLWHTPRVGHGTGLSRTLRPEAGV